MHPIAWFIWLALAALTTLLTRNPLYLVVMFGIVLLVADVVRDSDSPLPGLAVAPLRFALFAIPVGALFNGLTSHVGETVLARLPPGIPLIGGPITAEAVAFGAINGLVLATLFATFTVLNLAVPVRSLVGYLPRAFYPIAVVSAIAVTFAPSTLRQFQQVREAQAIRGHQMRGLKDWFPLFMPVLIGGLERALQLSEAMTARGFAASTAEMRARATGAAQALSAGGLVTVLVGGILLLVPGGAAWAPLCLLVGGVLVGVAVWRAGRDVHTTRYRHPRWTWADTGMTLGAMVAVVFLLLGSETRSYTPYPLLSWPLFDVGVGCALLGLAVPALLALASRRSVHDHA